MTRLEFLALTTLSLVGKDCKHAPKDKQARLLAKSPPGHLAKSVPDADLFSKVDKYADGSPMTDLKCDGVVYKKMDGVYFRRNHIETINVKWFGAKGDGITDDTAALSKALNVVSNIGGVLIIPKGSSFYKVTSTISAKPKQGISVEIRGEGKPEIRLTRHTTADLLSLTSMDKTASASLIISGIKFNGIGVLEQWNEETDEYYWHKLKQVNAIVASFPNVYIKNCSISNCYGMGIRVYHYKSAIIEAVDTVNVGGKWKLFGPFDSFGDSLYFAHALSHKSKAVVEGCDLKGYDKSRPTLSRCGIVFEYLSGECVVRKTTINGYNRGVHYESSGGKTLSISDCSFDRNDLNIFYMGDLSQIVVDSSVFKNMGNGNFGSLRGLLGGSLTPHLENLKSVSFNHCLIYSNGGLGQDLGTLIFNNCIINISDQWVLSSISCQLKTCKVYFKERLYIHEGRFEATDSIFEGLNTRDFVFLHKEGGGTVKPAVLTNCTVRDGVLFIVNSHLICKNSFFIKKEKIFTSPGFVKCYGSRAEFTNVSLDSPSIINLGVPGWGEPTFIGIDNRVMIKGVVKKIAQSPILH